jgi:hypothetical protein
MCLLAKDSRNYRISYKFAACEVTRTYHLQFVLPKFLLLRLVQERELSDMMDEEIPQDW